MMKRLFWLFMGMGFGFGMSFWVVSDLNDAELDEFVQRLRA